MSAGDDFFDDVGWLATWAGMAFGVFLVFAWLVETLGPIVSKYWPWILCAVVCCVGLVVYATYTSYRRQAEAQRLEEKMHAEAAAYARDKTQRAANSAIKDFSRHLKPCLVIDSNIWMNEQYDPFFLLLAAACLRSGHVLKLFGPQFDEIANVKRKTKYGDKRSKRARVAIHRIEELQKLRLLRIEPVTVEAQSDAYADPLLIELVVSSARKGVKCTFISDDRELRVRLRQHLANYPKKIWSILEMTSLSQQCGAMQRAIQLKALGEWQKLKRVATQMGEGEAR